MLVTLVPRATQNIIRLTATYHDEAEKRDGHWLVTKSFAQYLSTETTPRDLPLAVP